ncbi:MAG: hypothetical protein MPN21_00215 [Thermoanaerobaculia bacterium]|nr:hypothetical protein [Thermoanaerobaculia bacterium]
MKRRSAICLALAPLLVLAGLAHWRFEYQPRLRPAAPEDDLPARILSADGWDTAVWIAHPHQNLPALAETTGLDGPGLAAALRLAGIDPPDLDRFRVPPASSLAVAVGEGGREWVAAARVHFLAAGFFRLAGTLAGNPWLRGGTVRWTSVDDQALDVTVSWRGTTWVASTDPESAATLGASAGSSARSPAIAWIDHRSGPEQRKDGPGPLPFGAIVLQAEEGRVQLASQGSRLASSMGQTEAADGLRAGRRVIAAAEALLLLVQRSRPETGVPDQSMLLLPFPPATDTSELPRAALLHRLLPDGREGKIWDLPGEGLLEIVGHNLPSDTAANWTIRATDRVALGGALAAAPALEAASEGGLPTWGLWLDVVPASVEIDRLARGLESSPLLSRSERQMWRDAAHVLRAMARHPARVEGYVEGEALLLRWSAEID